MSILKNVTITIKTSTAEDFFDRVRQKIKAIQRKKTLAPSYTISFEDPEDMLQFLSANRRNLLNVIRQHPELPISQLAEMTHRDRKVVSMDIKKLAHFGLVEIVEKNNPGHGKYKTVTATTDSLKLEAVL